MNTNAIARRLKSIERKGGLRSVDLASLLGTRPETVSRWKLGKAFPRSDAERTLLDLEFLVNLLSDIYQSEEARNWFYLRQQLLAGVAPSDMIRAGKIQELITAVDGLLDEMHV
jgi:transcriptional regulator with XRE-family HTH domain